MLNVLDVHVYGSTECHATNVRIERMMSGTRPQQSIVTFLLVTSLRARARRNAFAYGGGTDRQAEEAPQDLRAFGRNRARSRKARSHGRCEDSSPVCPWARPFAR